MKDKSWARTPVDSFILAKLEQNNLTPSKPASKETLIRRATYDLIGLPPTPEEVRAFVSDHSPNAFEKVVDRLLNSPHYGERWGRFWLDTARYADTTGNDAKNEDYRYEYAWTYRDWVINSFNADLPYNQFLMQQIAADQLPGVDKNPDSLAALGFLTVGKRFQNKNDTIDERIDTVTKATMALTVSCARCHDHKFDPIPTADYYSLHGLFSSIEEPEQKPLVGRPPSPGEKANYERKLAELEAKNREAYYNILEEQGSEWRKKAAGYILASLYSAGPHRDPAKRLEAVKEFDLDGNKNNGQLLVVARVERRGNPVLAPFQWFAELPSRPILAKGGIGPGSDRPRRYARTRHGLPGRQCAKARRATSTSSPSRATLPTSIQRCRRRSRTFRLPRCTTSTMSPKSMASCSHRSKARPGHSSKPTARRRATRSAALMMPWPN